MATRLDTNDPGFEAAFQALLETKRESGAGVDDAVRRILEDVRLKGDEAVIAYTREFDGFELTAASMAVTADEIEAAKAASDDAVIDALEFAAGPMPGFHEPQKPHPLDHPAAARPPHALIFSSLPGQLHRFPGTKTAFGDRDGGGVSHPA